MKDLHEKALRDVHKKALRELKKAATHENIKLAEKAEQALSDYLARKVVESGNVEASFKTLRALLAYLQEEGWKIEKTKLYLDKDKGKIRKQENGTYAKKDVDEYARLCLSKTDGSNTDTSDLTLRKEVAATESEEEEAKKRKRINDIAEGKLILRTEVDQKHTAKLARLISLVEKLIYGGTLDEAVDIVGGNMKKLPKMQDLLMKKLKNILLEYAKSPKFSIPKKSMLEAEEFKEDGE